MKEKKEKKEIRIPRLAVYLMAMAAAIIICIGMSFAFGVALCGRVRAYRSRGRRIVSADDAL